MGFDSKSRRKRIARRNNTIRELAGKFARFTPFSGASKSSSEIAGRHCASPGLAGLFQATLRNGKTSVGDQLLPQV
jgi:hypothetical protein